MKILFVCTGNTCRSPLAAALLQHMLKEEVEVRSAGIAAIPGLPASEHVRTILKEKGIEVEHQSQLVNEELMNWADLVLTMTVSHKMALRSRFAQHQDKIYTLKEYVSASETHEGMPVWDMDIQDPFGGDLETYRSCAAEIEEALARLKEKIAKN